MTAHTAFGHNTIRLEDWHRHRAELRRRERIYSRVRRAAFCLAGAFVLWLLLTGKTNAQEITPRQIDNWIVAYSVERSSIDYPYVRLVADVRRVVDCESMHLDADVINGRRHGALGEVGPLQFMPGPRSIFWQSSAAAAGWTYTDMEANVAAGVELIARGMGPRNWSCW